MYETTNFAETFACRTFGFYGPLLDILLNAATASPCTKIKLGQKIKRFLNVSLDIKPKLLLCYRYYGRKYQRFYPILSIHIHTFAYTYYTYIAYMCWLRVIAVLKPTTTTPTKMMTTMIRYSHVVADAALSVVLRHEVD